MLRVFILIFFFFLTTLANGQGFNRVQDLSNMTLVSKKLEYLKILNDTTLWSSINSDKDTALFFLRNDTFYIRQKYLQTDQTGTKWIERLYGYKVIKIAPDSLTLKNKYPFGYKPDDWEDTLVFVNIEQIKEPVADFRFLKLEYSSPWTGERNITVDSLGRVNFVDNPIQYSINNPTADKNAKPRSFSGQLTMKELINFKNLLSKSLPSRLPLKRGCPMDGSTSNFEIQIGTKNIVSTGCDLSWTHASLLEYLFDIDQNKGLVKSQSKTNYSQKY
ncbi:hypothetical protein [Niastella populi]|uniref:Uncharacterized protein n=1 Tax=Niastella populi TaxID=550983 RepID=A0A1V9FZE3_9BACT|nr:hypothetical protein [Niastella populi]OQP63697.1 hypothetical protein A4R26_17165 [Niastella populi]